MKIVVGIINWLVILAFLTMIGFVLEIAQGATIDELRQEKQKEEIKPESLKTMIAWRASPFAVIDGETGRLLGWKIVGEIKFSDKKDWVKDLRFYLTKKYPLHVDKMGHKTSLIDRDCESWKMFIRQEFWEEQMILLVQSH